ncbi:unnamed protein product [Caretta caretta]
MSDPAEEEKEEDLGQHVHRDPASQGCIKPWAAGLEGEYFKLYGKAKSGQKKGPGVPARKGEGDATEHNGDSLAANIDDADSSGPTGSRVTGLLPLQSMEKSILAHPYNPPLTFHMASGAASLSLPHHTGGTVKTTTATLT